MGLLESCHALPYEELGLAAFALSLRSSPYKYVTWSIVATETVTVIPNRMVDDTIIAFLMSCRQLGTETIRRY
jgi:hypothetical protein